VSANINVNIYREQDPSFGDIFIVFPGFNSVTPAGTGTTTNTIESPSGAFYGHADSSGGGSSSAILFSFNDLLDDITNGPWTIYINKGLQTERQFQFSVSLTGLTTNLLAPVKIITPTNGATGIPATGPFQWSGLPFYSDLTVSKQYFDNSGFVSADLPLTDTNWPSPPILAAGSNSFNVTYTSNNFTGIAFTVPVDTFDSQTVVSWSAQGNLLSTATSQFVSVAASGPVPVTLINTTENGTSFQFSFLSQSGTSNIVQYRTNLVVGVNWQNYTNIPGDGTLKAVSIPLSLFNPAKQGFVRVSTQ
jgi:hypothetical protein